LKIRLLGPLDETDASNKQFVGGKSGLMNHTMNLSRDVRWQFVLAALPTRDDFEDTPPRIAKRYLGPSVA
jgi:hypothetical protein